MKLNEFINLLTENAESLDSEVAFITDAEEHLDVAKVEPQGDGAPLLVTFATPAWAA